MKKLLIALALLTSTQSFASESINEIAVNKKMAETINSRIEAIVNDKCESLNCYVSALEERNEEMIQVLREKGASEEQINQFADVVDTKIAEYREIGDLETIKALEISRIQEFQSSINVMFMFTGYTLLAISQQMFWMPPMAMVNLLLLPGALILDIILLPVTFTVSLATGL